MAALHAGSAAPAFTLTDTKGNVLTLESLKGKKVYLILFRVAPCPLCNLTVSRLKKMAPELSKANMEIVCVFESTMSELKGYSGKQATDSFNLYVDERKMAIYKDYRRVRSCSGSLLGRAICWHMCYDCKIWSVQGWFVKGCPPAACNPILLSPRGLFGMPVDVLIDESGKIVEIQYGKVIGEHMPIEKVKAFAGIAGGGAADMMMER